MNPKRRAVVLAVLLLHTVFSAGQEPAEKIRREAAKALEKNSRVTVELFDGRKLQGYVTETATKHFVVAGEGRSAQIAYGDVKKLKHHGTPERRRALVALAVVGGLIGLTLAAAAGTR